VNFEIKLPLFEGPFDLLLFFIERDELDIYDIPISKITDEFLAYVHQLEKINIELASEFILVAATLMRIKAKMLLPRPELDEKGNEIDPREELVQHLLEYKKYKSVVAEFSKMEDDQFHKNARGNVMAEIRKLAEASDSEAELQSLDLYKLLRVYEKVIKRFEAAQNKPVHTVVQYPYTIEQQRNFLMDKLVQQGRFTFAELISEHRSKIAAIFNFLAILDLVQLGQVVIHIGEGFNNFWVEKLSEAAEVSQTN
jgi:segregation and condensation protein A